jgi:DNA-binding transcriptional MerR regulator
MQIGEVARQVGVATSAIRFYEEAGLIPEPDRTPSGYRDYEPSVVDRLTFIRAGQAVGLTLSELSDVLKIRDGGEAPCRHVAELIDVRIGEIDDRMKDLRRLRRDLADLAVKAADFDPDECPPESVCRILSGTD